MEGPLNFSFANAKQQKKRITILTPKKKCTRQKRRYGITKYAEKNG